MWVFCAEVWWTLELRSSGRGYLFVLSRKKPGVDVARKYIKRFRDAPFNHPYVGCTKPSNQSRKINLKNHPCLKNGWKLIHITKDIGSGESVYRRASEIVKNWNMHKDSAWAGIYLDEDAKEGVGTGLATFAKTFLKYIWVLNPCRTVYSIVDEEIRNGTEVKSNPTVPPHRTEGT
mmetsp:Transcript_16673/g.29914  ORF Transcript_16673/g.29914 Transcript_16673/m.29914 type:complete len:176 (+) Transcript_16673:128-655(+)